MSGVSPQILLVALVTKLGGQVRLTRDELWAAEDMELEHSQDMHSFAPSIQLRVRSAVTVEGTLAADVLEIEEHTA